MSTMSSPLVALLFSVFLFLLITDQTDALNISAVLGKYPDFTNFNNYLIQSGVASRINSLQTVTVLAVANGNIGEVSGLSSDALKKILSVHVVLDYVDKVKLDSIPLEKPTQYTNLYQKSGSAQNQEGNLKVIRRKGGEVAFGSAAPGSNPNAMFVKFVDLKPYDISVIQLSNFINVPASPPSKSTSTPPPSQSHAAVASPPSDNSTTTPTSSPPKPSKAPSSTPSAAPEAAAATPANADADMAPAGSAADNKGSSSAAVSLITSGDHLQAVLMMLITSAWFLLTMV